MGGNKEAPSLLLKTYIVSVFVHSFLFVCLFSDLFVLFYECWPACVQWSGGDQKGLELELQALVKHPVVLGT